MRTDSRGIMRCYGRMGRSESEGDAKYPILTLQKSALAGMIVRDAHQRSYPGVNHTIALVRQKFWIPQSRSQVALVVRKCLQCQKFNNLPYKYSLQDDLPKRRVTRSSFQHMGLDYFGPLVKLQPEKPRKML